MREIAISSGQLYLANYGRKIKMSIIKEKKLVLLRLLTAIALFGSISHLSLAQTEGGALEERGLASPQAGETPDAPPLISIDFQDADLKDVLKVFSRQAGLNFIASENIQDRKVTLYLDKVSVEDALSTIMSANNLTYEQQKDSKIFVVKEWARPKIETITKVFPLQYARVKGYELASTEEQGKGSKQVGIKEVVEKILTEYGKVIEDSRTNSLIIIDVPSQFPKIEQAIAELDIKLPQVMIEAEVVETSVTAIDKLGIEWGGTYGELITAKGAARSATFPFTKPQEMGKVGPAGDISGLYMGYVSANNLGGTLAMLKRDIDTKILARPRILTLNNETAEIKITADTAVASMSTTTSAEGTATTTIEAERVETGVSLWVTPQINRQDEITMAIEPSVISVEASEFFPGTFVDPQTRSAKTMVTVSDGETVIIGGLIRTDDSKMMRKVPFLGNIPLLGSIFRKKDDEVSDKELIIFITPHLVKEGTETAMLVLENQASEQAEGLNLTREEAMEMILDQFEQ